MTTSASPKTLSPALAANFSRSKERRATRFTQPEGSTIDGAISTSEQMLSKGISSPVLELNAASSRGSSASPQPSFIAKT